MSKVTYLLVFFLYRCDFFSLGSHFKELISVLLYVPIDNSILLCFDLKLSTE